MEDDLACCRLAVDLDRDAVGAGSLLDRIGDAGKCRRERGELVFRNLKNVSRMFLGHDQRMARVDGMDIEEGEGRIIFVHLCRADLSGNNFAEKTLHMMGDYRACTWSFDDALYIIGVGTGIPLFSFPPK